MVSMTLLTWCARHRRSTLGPAMQRGRSTSYVECWRCIASSGTFAPELVICQSEFDAIKLYLLSHVLRFRYRVLVFGQMYQFKTDITRYSTVFRRHLKTIVASRPGYRDTVAMPPPHLSLPIRVINEIVSRLKYRALRKAEHIFTVSNQVQWEVSLLYGRAATVCRAAFTESFLDVGAIGQPRPVGHPIRLLSVSRLVDKKRVDLTIAAFTLADCEATLTIVGSGPSKIGSRNWPGKVRVMRTSGSWGP